MTEIMTEVINAKIESTMLGFEDHGLFTFWLRLDYGGGGQGFGGYVLGKSYTTDIITGILKTVGVDNWEDLKGQHIRVEKGIGFNGIILRIGHFLEDKWFDPKKPKDNGNL